MLKKTLFLLMGVVMASALMLSCENPSSSSNETSNYVPPTIREMQANRAISRITMA